MGILVDTCVWSRALRKSEASTDEDFLKILASGNLVMIGPIRQEILCGIKSTVQFDALKTKLDAFVDVPLQTQDYIEAARCFNHCRSKGIQGSMVDFLLCGFSLHHKCKIYTYDRDFERYSEALGEELLIPRT